MDHYEVAYDGKTDLVAVGSQQEILHQITNLTPCTDYKFEIKSVGEGSSGTVSLDGNTGC